MCFDQLVAREATNLKEAPPRVVDEPFHDLRTEYPLDDRLADLRQAEGKRQQEFADAHVVEREALDQGGGAVLFRQCPFPDRNRIADEPRADDQQPCQCKGEQVHGDRLPAHMQAPEPVGRDQSGHERRQNHERRPRQAQQPEQRTGGQDPTGTGSLQRQQKREGRNAVERESEALGHDDTRTARHPERARSSQESPASQNTALPVKMISAAAAIASTPSANNAACMMCMGRA